MFFLLTTTLKNNVPHYPSASGKQKYMCTVRKDFTCFALGSAGMLPLYRGNLPLSRKACHHFLNPIIQKLVHLKKTIKAKYLIFLSHLPPPFPKLALHKHDDLPLGDKHVVSETFTGTTGLTWCLTHLIRILISVCRRGFYKWSDNPDTILKHQLCHSQTSPRRGRGSRTMSGECVAPSSRPLLEPVWSPAGL